MLKRHLLINAWTGIGPIDNVMLRIINTWLDFIFLFFYSLFLYNAVKSVSGYFTGFLSNMAAYSKGALGSRDVGCAGKYRDAAYFTWNISDAFTRFYLHFFNNKMDIGFRCSILYC